MKTRPKRNSFHTWIAVKIATAAIPGAARGSMMRRKAPKSLAPSIAADSRSSAGMVSKVNFVMITANGRLNTMFSRIRPSSVPLRPDVRE